MLATFLIFVAATGAYGQVRQGVNLLGCHDCFNFAAPVIVGVDNIASPQIGQLVYDSEAKAFKGFKDTGSWESFNANEFNKYAYSVDSTISSDADFVAADASPQPIALTLPPAFPMKGRVIVIFKEDSTFNSVVIDGDGSEQVGGQSSTTINTQGEALRVYSNGYGWDIVDRDIPAKWINYTPTFDGFGTVVGSNQCSYRRDGPDLLLRCRFTTGTHAASEARVYLPSGLTAASFSPNALQIGGFFERVDASTGPVNTVLIEPSPANYVAFGVPTLSGATKILGSAIPGSGATLMFSAVRVPISQWQ